MTRLIGQGRFKRQLAKTGLGLFLGIVFLAAAPSFAQGSTNTPGSDLNVNPPSMIFEPVDFDSFDTGGLFSSKRVPIKGYLVMSNSKEPAPGAVLNPACEGLLVKDGVHIKVKYRRMAHVLHRLGITVLLVDGFNPRGFPETCSKGMVSGTARLMDAFGGLEYLRSRKDVDASKVVMVGWGANGGLEGMSEGTSLPKGLRTGFAGAVFYYPECAKAGSPFAPYAPIQVFVGGKDSWNPASACRNAAARQKAGSSPFNIKVYPEAYHSFDGPGEPRVNSYHPKLGMVGRNNEAALDSYLQAEFFLSDLLTLPVKKDLD